MKTFINLNGTEWLVEVGWKKLEKDQKSFDTAHEIWRKKAAYLETHISHYPGPMAKFPFLKLSYLEGVSDRATPRTSHRYIIMRIFSSNWN